MSHPGASSPGSTFSKILLAVSATVILSVAFGADFGSGEASGKSWNRQSSERGLGGLLPWRGGRRKANTLKETKMRLSDERKRRVEAEHSLSVARTRLSESETSRDALEVRVQELETQVRDRDRRIFDLRGDVARLSAASPELVDQLIGFADEALRKARFDTALELTADAAEMLQAISAEDGSDRITRLEYVRATALVALGDDEGAARSLERLLEVDPDFALDEASSSPKLVRVLQEVRADLAEGVARG